PKPKRWPSNRRPSRRRSSRTLTPSRRRNRIFDDEKRSWRTTAGPSMSWPAKPKRTGAQSTDAPGIFKAGRPKSPRSPRRSRLEFKRSIDSRVSAVEQKETEMDRLSKDVAARGARVVPEEARLAERANVAEHKEADLKAREDRLTARTQTLDGREQELSSREV